MSTGFINSRKADLSDIQHQMDSLRSASTMLADMDQVAHALDLLKKLEAQYKAVAAEIKAAEKAEDAFAKMQAKAAADAERDLQKRTRAYEAALAARARMEQKTKDAADDAATAQKKAYLTVGVAGAGGALLAGRVGAEAIGGRPMEAAAGAAQGLAGVIGGLINTSVPGLGTAFAAVAAATIGAFENVGNAITAAVGKANPAVLKQFQLASDDLSATIGHAFTPMVELFTRVTEKIGDFVAKLHIGDVVEGLVSAFTNVGTALNDAFGPNIEAETTALQAFVSLLGDGIRDAGTMASDFIHFLAPAIQLVTAPLRQMYDSLALVLAIFQAIADQQRKGQWWPDFTAAVTVANAKLEEFKKRTDTAYAAAAGNASYVGIEDVSKNIVAQAVGMFERRRAAEAEKKAAEARKREREALPDDNPYGAAARAGRAAYRSAYAGFPAEWPDVVKDREAEIARGRALSVYGGVGAAMSGGTSGGDFGPQTGASGSDDELKELVKDVATAVREGHDPHGLKGGVRK